MSRQLKLVFSAADKTGSRSRPRLSQDDQQSADSEPATFEPPPPKRQKQGEAKK